MSVRPHGPFFTKGAHQDHHGRFLSVNRGLQPSRRLHSVHAGHFPVHENKVNGIRGISMHDRFQGVLS